MNSPQPAPDVGRPPPLPSNIRDLAEAVREQLWFGDDDPVRTHLDASRSMAADAAKATGIKPFPASAQRVIGLLTNPDVAATKVRMALEGDPAITAGLLRVANSAAYAPRSPISSVEDAIVRLGNRHVRDIVAGVAAMGMFTDVGGAGAIVRDHSSRVAAIAKVLAFEWRFGGVENVFLAGLLHDIGKLLLMQVGSVDYKQLDAAVLETPDEAHIHERAITGYDHAVLGGHVLGVWQLADEVAHVVAWHHQPGRAYEKGGEIGVGVAFVRLANRIEYHFRKHPGIDEAFAEELANDGAASYAGYSRDVLVASSAKLRAAADQMKSAIAG
jgi:HD-like signal output (HDOD) protein